MNSPDPVIRVRPDTKIYFTKDDGKTQQSFAKDADINNIMAQYAKTGQIHQLNPAQPSYGYIPSTTYHQSLNLVHEANEMFAALPSQVRKRFGHSPKDFLEFALDEKNLTEMAELGLLTEDAAKAALVAVSATETILSPPEQPAAPLVPPTPPD